MEKIIIHVGYHKSASTFLQKEVFTQLPVNYVYFEGPRRRMLDIVEGAVDFDAEAVRAWVERQVTRKYPGKRNNMTLLSHEELSGHPHGYKEISPTTTADHLKTLYPAARILIIVRNQFDYITSLYGYRIAIKGYESRGLNRFITEEGAKGLFNHLEYDVLVQYYQALFGSENVLVLPMELLTRTPDELFNRLFAFIDIQYHQLEEIPPAVNISTKNMLILSLWRPINYLFERLLGVLTILFRKQNIKLPFRKLRYAFYNSKASTTLKLDRILPRGSKLDVTKYPEYGQLVERFGRSNAQLEKLFGYDLTSLGYPVKRE